MRDFAGAANSADGRSRSLTVVDGGATRAESVRAADGGAAGGHERRPGPRRRPGADHPNRSSTGCAAALAAGAVAVIPVMPVVDTVKTVDADHRRRTPPSRPEGGHRTAPRETCGRCRRRRASTSRRCRGPTKAAGRLRRRAGRRPSPTTPCWWNCCGVPVYAVRGASQSLKITTPLDLILAEGLLEGPPRRTLGGRLSMAEPASAGTRSRAPESVSTSTPTPPRTRPSRCGSAACCGKANAALPATPTAIRWRTPPPTRCSPPAESATWARTSAPTGPEYAGASGVTLLAEAARIVRAAGFRDRQHRRAVRGQPAQVRPAPGGIPGVLSAAAGAPVSVATTSDGLGFTAGRGDRGATAVVGLGPHRPGSDRVPWSPCPAGPGATATGRRAG